MATKNAINSSDPIEVSAGGLGASTHTDHSPLIGSGTAAISDVVVGTTGLLFIGDVGADPFFDDTATGDFTFTSSTATVDRTLTVANTDNTSTSSIATFQLTTGGGTAGSPTISHTVTGQETYTVGIDASDGYEYKITDGTFAAGTDRFIITSTGVVTKPTQPAFSAVGSAGTQTNVTGDGTLYTVVFAIEDFDQGNVFDGTSTFTAPVAGKYQFNIGVRFDEFTSSHTDAKLQFVTTSYTYETNLMNPYIDQNPGTDNYAMVGIFTDMAASDTAIVKIQVSGGTKVIELVGGQQHVVFSGYLVC